MFTASHVPYFRRDFIKRRMAIHFIVGGIEQKIFAIWGRGRDGCARDHPNADALLTAGIDITGIVDGHFGIGCMKATDMLVRQATFAANEYFPQGPIFVAHRYVLKLKSGGSVLSKRQCPFSDKAHLQQRSFLHRAMLRTDYHMNKKNERMSARLRILRRLAI